MQGCLPTLSPEESHTEASMQLKLMLSYQITIGLRILAVIAIYHNPYCHAKGIFRGGKQHGFASPFYFILVQKPGQYRMSDSYTS
jgi:hypothetical protein